MCGVFIGVLRSWHGGCRSRCRAWLARPNPCVDAARTCTKGSALALVLTSTTIPRGGTLSAPSTAPPVTTFRWPVPGMAISPRRRADRHRQPASVCPPGRLRTLPVHRLPPEWGVAPEDRDAGGDRVHPAHAPPRAPTRLPPHPLVRLLANRARQQKLAECRRLLRTPPPPPPAEQAGRAATDYRDPRSHFEEPRHSSDHSSATGERGRPPAPRRAGPVDGHLQPNRRARRRRRPTPAARGDGDAVVQGHGAGGGRRRDGEPVRGRPWRA